MDDNKIVELNNQDTLLNSIENDEWVSAKNKDELVLLI